jgi:hypothetical protein
MLFLAQLFKLFPNFWIFVFPPFLYKFLAVYAWDGIVKSSQSIER